MGVIGTDGLALWVGDGSSTEVFNPLKGSAVIRLEIAHRANISRAVGADAWQALVGASGRSITVECECYATDDLPAQRLKLLAMTGILANFRLKLTSSETATFSGMVTQYREDINSGEIKRMRFRLESSGVASLV